MSHVEGDVVEYLSLENVMDTKQVTSYPIEFSNSLELSGVPSHKLRLKIGVPILLMRNLGALRLWNGTLLQIIHLGRNIIKREIVLIPRIPIIPTDLPFQFKIIQFPPKAAFAMTIKKKCFSHGELNVACSRVSNPQNLHILAQNDKTKNVVYRNLKF
ncbi:hypothetical protein K1T71_002847 [Dendrolimus kikuchii]|uniref:Uncharacterized protein n=1 Tax=Dendrolimus kikuchii TaxID=765133 RepID=A0ACC1DEA6_9NEOP|nr:hypothetical protein K1T71_002847 [Dendrolimus kikuchii]